MEAQNQNLESVLKKLRKLQNLYEGAKKVNSEGEALAAAAAIQRLLIQYNLTMDEIGQEDDRKDTILEERWDGFTYKSIGGKWESLLCHVLCKWNFCKSFEVGGSYKRLMIVGKKENIETVKWLREMLSERFVEFSKKRFKEFQQTEEFAFRPMGKDKFQRSYLIGCCNGLDAKLREENEREKKEDADFGAKVTALVVRSDAAIQEYVESKYKVGNGRRTKENYDSARHAGFSDGKNTDLYKPVSEGARAQANALKMLA